MSPAAANRSRPTDGGIVWHGRTNLYECLGCGEFMPLLGRRRSENPETVARIRELMVLDHTECWEYADARMARLARRFRKEVKRQLLLQRKGQGRCGE